MLVQQGDARISAGNNLLIDADKLDNTGSHLLASGFVSLSGSQLNNQSFFGYTQDEYNVYRYYGKLAMIPNDGHLQYGDASADDRVTFTLSGAPEYVTRDTGQALRAVIQAGKNVTAVFPVISVIHPPPQMQDGSQIPLRHLKLTRRQRKISAREWLNWRRMAQRC